jgi:hypothetical protein
MFKIRLKFLTLNKENLIDSIKSWDKYYFLKIKFNRKNIKNSSGVYDEQLNLISWAHEPLNLIQFDVISRCKSSNVFITIHQINGGKCIGKLKFNLKSFLIDKENIQETICLDLKTKLNNNLFLTGSKLVFDLITNNLSFDLFPSKLQITKLPVENQVLNIHVKLHELFVKEEAFYKQAFIRIKINKQHENSKLFKIDKNIKIGEYFIIRIKYFELFEHFIEIYLVEEHHIFKHQNKMLAEFSMLLHNIYVNYDRENHGFSNKYLFLSSKFTLKTSIFINSSDYLPLDEENAEDSNILIDQISNERLSVQKHFSLVFYYIELYNYSDNFSTQISCKLNFKSNKNRDLLIDVINIKNISFKNDFVIICQELVIKLKCEKITQILFEFLIEDNKKFYSSVKFHDLLHMTSYPLLLKLCKDNDFEYPIGQILVKFDFLTENVNNETLKINNFDCKIDELIHKYSKYSTNFFYITLNGIYQLPSNLKDSIRFTLKILNQQAKTEYFFLENDKFLMTKSIKWQNCKPVLLAQFKMPNQIYRISVLKFIDYIINEILNEPKQDNAGLILKESIENFKLIEINTEEEVDRQIKNYFLNLFEENLNEFEKFSIQIDLFRNLFEFVKTLTFLPNIQIILQKKQNFKVKVLYKTFISVYNSYYSVFSTHKGKHDSCLTLLETVDKSLFRPVLDMNNYCFSNKDDLIQFFKNNFTKMILADIATDKIFNKTISKHEIIEDFMFEVQRKIKDEWKTMFFIDKLFKQYKEKKYLNNDFLIVKDWYREDEEEKWTYSNNFKQKIWLGLNIDSQFKYRRLKWIRKSCLKTQEAIDSNNMISDSQLNKILNSNKTSRISVLSVKSIKINYLISINFIETKVLFNILINFKKNFLTKINSYAFFSLKVFIFDKNKTLISRRISKNINIEYVNHNPEWESNLQFNFEEFEQKSNIQIFFELFFNYSKYNRIKECSLGKSIFDYEFRKHGAFKRTIINFESTTFHQNAVGLVEFNVNLNQNSVTHNHKNDIKKVSKNVTIKNFGIRLKHDFLQTMRINSKLEILFVMNGLLLKSKLSIFENYSIFNDKTANNEYEVIKFENILFNEDYYILTNPLDIYLSDCSNTGNEHSIFAYCRINEVYEHNSDHNKYRVVYKENSSLKDVSLNKDNYLTKLERIKKEDLIPDEEKSEFNEKIIKITADFWTRYYDSLKFQYKHKDDLKRFKDVFCLNILEHDLEHEYDGLSDYGASKIDLFDFKNSKTVFGQLRMKIDISKNDELINESKPTVCLPTLCVIRLYIIKAFNFKNTKNPYIEVLCKNFDECQHLKFSRTLDDSISENLNPDFGEFFEFEVLVPKYFQIEIRVLDKNFHKFHHDQLIGTTSIELEHRLTSKFRALCGLPVLYHVENSTEGNSKNLFYSLLVWRDILKPSEILKKICDRNKLKCEFDLDNLLIEIENQKIGLNSFNITYLDELYVATTNIFEQLCLNVLNTEFNLVKEHIETRTLYKVVDEKMIETGKIHLWLDIFPIGNSLIKKSLPHPVDIQHRKPVSLELRCIVWSLMIFGNNSNKIINETKNVFIKSWISGYENQTQKTDTHFHCRNKANFNYRFVFEFDYLWQEKCFIKLSDSKHSRIKVPPKLHIQILTSDLLSVHSHVIGSVEFDLNQINLPIIDEPQKLFNMKKSFSNTQTNSKSLFKIGQIRGWWPCENLSEDFKCCINMSIEILNLNEVKLKPVGKGRADPNMNPKLDDPEREPLFDISLLNPYHRLIQFLKFILLKRKNKYFFYIFLLIFVLLCIWSIPSALINRIVTRVI